MEIKVTENNKEEEFQKQIESLVKVINFIPENCKLEMKSFWN